MIFWLAVLATAAGMVRATAGDAGRAAGGGITGAGVARDAALRGLRTALVERNDFGAGTSSRSSKLIHGGVRYLQQGEIGLVREAAAERDGLGRIAPHLALPRRMASAGATGKARLRACTAAARRGLSWLVSSG